MRLSPCRSDLTVIQAVRWRPRLAGAMPPAGLTAEDLVAHPGLPTYARKLFSELHAMEKGEHADVWGPSGFPDVVYLQVLYEPTKVVFCLQVEALHLAWRVVAAEVHALLASSCNSK